MIYEIFYVIYILNLTQNVYKTFNMIKSSPLLNYVYENYNNLVQIKDDVFEIIHMDDETTSLRACVDIRKPPNKKKKKRKYKY